MRSQVDEDKRYKRGIKAIHRELINLGLKEKNKKVLKLANDWETYYKMSNQNLGIASALPRMVEYLVERLNKIYRGKVTATCQNGCDFSDGTDSKIAVTNIWNATRETKSKGKHQIKVKGCNLVGADTKIGGIRGMIIDDMGRSTKLTFLVIPNSIIERSGKRSRYLKMSFGSGENIRREITPRSIYKKCECSIKEWAILTQDAMEKRINLKS